MENWLRELNKNVTEIFHDLNLFKEIGSIIDNNPIITSMDSTALEWIHKSGVGNLVISIGRICDTSGKTKSLVKFLEQLKQNKNQIFISRKRYTQENIDLRLDYQEEIANKTFDRLAGAGQDYFPVKEIEGDIKILTKDNPCKKILNLRNNIVAHIGNENIELPTYDELFDGFRTIEKIMKKYNTLITGDAIVDFTPTIQGYWQEVFTVPWVEKGTD